MSHHKCQTKRTPNYEVKQRYIPTYIHQQIFEQAPLRPYLSRCTPTFHSTVFDTEGYNIKTVHSKNVRQPVQAVQPEERQVQTNKSPQKKVQNNSHAHKVFSASKDQWFDHTKEEILSSIPNGQNRGYSRERKYVDLSSDLVFTDFTYENKSVILRTAVQPVKQCLKQEDQIIQRPEVINVNNNHVIEAPKPVLKEVRENNAVTHQVNQEKPAKTVKIVEKSNPSKSNQQNLKVKGRNPLNRPQTAQKARALQQKPTFTVVRKSRIHHQ